MSFLTGATMRLISVVALASSLLAAGPAFAQGWTEYVNQNDFFTVSFPGEPKVQEITYETEFSLKLPAHVYSVDNGPNRYSLTVVDYSDTATRHAERLKNCKADLGGGDSCGNPSRTELRGAILHATWNLIKRGGKLTHLNYGVADLVEGHFLQITNANESRTFAAIHMHENRLYILEGTVQKGAAAPGLFQQSLQFLDKEGKRIRYQSIYTNGFPPPPRTQYR
jgi:hypothetical protein